jgi:hypothetical protein
MASGKTSFVLYSDSKSIIELLSNEQAGLLLKTLFAYVNDENPKIDSSIALVFEMIKLQLKRDLKKWEQTKEGRSIAGKASAEARKLAKQSLTNSTNVDFVQQTSTNPTVSVNDSVSVSVSENEIKENNNKALPFRFFDSLIHLGAEKQLVSDWIAVRKLKKLSNTLTAFNGFKNELDKSGKGINEVLSQCVINSWGGFKAEWIKNKVIETIPVTGEKMIKYISNVNPTPAFMEESKFLAMQERNLSGGYIYKILP